MVDHLVPVKLRNKLISNEVSSFLYLYFLSNTKAAAEYGALFGIFTTLQHLLKIYINYLWMEFRPAKTTKVLSLETLSAYGMTSPHVDEGYILELLL